jgi:maltooligosyltrehalose trehalohydrolase
MQVRLLKPGGERLFPMERHGEFFEAVVEGAGAGSDYFYRLDGERDRPDPVSRHQPHGVHGPSRVVDPHDFNWRDGGWRGLPLEDYLTYELHVGLFSPEGTFEGALRRLDYLQEEVGVNAVELMPVGQFAGERDWGYDGVAPYAPQESYGGPEGLRRLVEACHLRGMAVVLDVVYNHLGPEGNYLAEFGPYFSERYRTPWGEAINFDGRGSDEVRRYFIDNALYWVREYHIDCLRLDAVHGIFDGSPRHILEELAEAVHEESSTLGRAAHVVAESDLNDVRLIDPVSRCGWGLDAQWNDDLHHALHTALTNERQGYYADFQGLEHLSQAINHGFVYEGQHSAFRGRRFGSSSRGRSPCRFIAFAQNHDQVGNRALGERLSTLVPFEAVKLAAGLVMLGPNPPLIFMGEEYGETTPFLYFTSFADEGLGEAVRRGRLEEFARFGWKEVPDPQAPETYEASRPDWGKRLEGDHAHLLALHRRLIDLRTSSPALTGCRSHVEATALMDDRLLVVERARGEDRYLLLASFNEHPVTPHLVLPGGLWRCLLDTSWPQFGGREPVWTQESVLAQDQPVMLRFHPYTLLVYAWGPGLGARPRS